MIVKKKSSNGLIIYQAKNGAIEFRGDFSHETIWATQAQIAEVFGVDVRTISEHFGNIFKNNELSKISVVRNFRNTANDGKTYNTQFYNLDAIISVGYRVNSKTATLFRQWATKTLREHITKGYTLNKKVILKNYDQFLKNVTDIQALLFTYKNVMPPLVGELLRINKN